MAAGKAKKLKLYSWNVNGARAVIKRGFLDWLAKEKPDILCLQESRAKESDLPEEHRAPKGYVSYWLPAQKAGYSGTAVYTREHPLSVTTMGSKIADDEGRVQVIEYPDFTILNGYWPNSQDERARLPYKLSFIRAITRFANKLVRDGKNIILCGDFNVAHQPIDLARPKQNENAAGYYIEEREALTRFLKNGYVDTFRQHCPDPGHYTWWSFRGGAREKNVGWRIDYHCVNKDFMPNVQRAWILPEVMGSDHCPVAIEVK